MKVKTAQQIVKETAEDLGLSQKKLADKIGAKSQQAVFSMLGAKNGMRIDNFVKLMNAMGYDVVVRNRVTDEETQIGVD